MSVIYRGTGSPQAIPDEEEILGLGLHRLRSPCPLPASIDIVDNLLPGKMKGIKIIENDYPVPTVILGNIAGGNTMLALHPTKEVFGSIVLRIAE
jgi:hypothetical protein